MAHWRDGGIGNQTGSDDRPIEEWTLLEKLAEIAAAPIGGNIPRSLLGHVNWGVPIKQIAQEAFDEIQRLRDHDWQPIDARGCPPRQCGLAWRRDRAGAECLCPPRRRQHLERLRSHHRDHDGRPAREAVMIDCNLRKYLEQPVIEHLEDAGQMAALRQLGSKHRTMQINGFVLLSIAISVKRIADALVARQEQ